MNGDLINKINQVKEEIDALDKARTLPNFSKSEHEIIGFKLFYKLIEYSVLKNLIPDYKEENVTNQILASNSLFDTQNLASVKDGNVIIDSAYTDLLNQQKNYLNNGKIS